MSELTTIDRQQRKEDKRHVADDLSSILTKFEGWEDYELELLRQLFEKYPSTTKMLGLEELLFELEIEIYKKDNAEDTAQPGDSSSVFGSDETEGYSDEEEMEPMKLSFLQNVGPYAVIPADVM